MRVIYQILRNAKIQRKAKNPWEAKLWFHLRGGRMLGLKFKRQVPIGNYILDFCCHEKRLGIELDGGQHSEGKHSDTDKTKGRYLKRENFKVLRFWNNELDKNLEGVLEIIRKNILE